MPETKRQAIPARSGDPLTDQCAAPRLHSPWATPLQSSIVSFLVAPKM
jgi:hypothetical protein